MAGATPESLGGLFPFNHPVSPEVEKATIEFYLGGIEKYLGYPMFNAPLGVFAARLGDRDRALHLLEKG